MARVLNYIGKTLIAAGLAGLVWTGVNQVRINERFQREIHLVKSQLNFEEKIKEREIKRYTIAKGILRRTDTPYPESIELYREYSVPQQLDATWSGLLNKCQQYAENPEIPQEVRDNLACAKRTYQEHNSWFKVYGLSFLTLMGGTFLWGLSDNK